MDTATLLNGVKAFLLRYVALGESQADAVALWVAHTWVLNAADATPYLSIKSAEKRSGKTRLLECLSLIVARPWYTGRASAAVLVRRVARDCPTLLLDESDAAFKGDREYSETLRAVLNSGHRQNGVASLCVKAGNDWDLRDFPVFCPKAIAGIGKLPDTVEDRSIPIVMKRRAPQEKVKRFKQRDANEEAAPLRDHFQTWAGASLSDLIDRRPNIPAELDDRAADGWEPLIAIADLAGEDWAERARAASRVLSAEAAHDDESEGIRLLRDIKFNFDEGGSDRHFSFELVQSLLGIEEAPWGDLRGGKPLDTRRLARLLKPYGIGPHQIRIGEKTQKGYEQADFQEAWERYLPVHKPQMTETTETAETNGDSQSSPEEPNVSLVSHVSVLQGAQGSSPATLSEMRRLSNEACSRCGSVRCWRVDGDDWVCSVCHPDPEMAGC